MRRKRPPRIVGRVTNLSHAEWASFKRYLKAHGWRFRTLERERTPRTRFVKALLITVLLAIAIGGCATAQQPPISASPIQDVAKAPALPKLGGFFSIEDGLKEAAFNLDQAVGVGALDKADPAPGCVHSTMQQLGLEEGQAPLPSFQPKTDTALGQGSVAYIRLRQAQRLSSGGGITVTNDCRALIGTFVIDAARGGLRIQPGGGLLPAIR